MHFRVRNRVIQLIRTVYDPEVKRGTSLIVGRLSKEAPQVTDELCKALTATELREVEDWIAHHGARADLAREHAASSVSDQLRLAMEWFSRNDSGEKAKLLAREISDSMQAMGTLLRQRALIPERKMGKSRFQSTGPHSVDNACVEAYTPPLKQPVSTDIDGLYGDHVNATSDRSDV